MVSSDVLTIVIPYIASISYFACIKRTIINNEVKNDERERKGNRMKRWRTNGQTNERTTEWPNERKSERQGENERAKVKEK